MDGGGNLSINDRNTKITLAGSNYVMTGGDEYTIPAGLPVERELGAADEALAEYVSKLTAPEAGRIRTCVQ